MTGFNILQAGFRAGSAITPDNGHWMKPGAIHHRSEQSMVSDTDAHTPRLADPPDWMKVSKPCDYMVWGEDWDQDLSGGDVKINDSGSSTAAELCHGCPVIAECLAAALKEEGTLTARNRYLIRGGKTPAERAAIALSAPVRAPGRPRREPQVSCGLEHDGECRWFDHPNGSVQCRTKVSAQERAARKRRNEKRRTGEAA